MSGPTNATSLMVSASLSALALPFSPEYLRLALTLGLRIGLIKLALGLARLGALVNFISTTVIIGFTADAGLLIIVAQLANFFGLPAVHPPSFTNALASFAQHAGEIDRWTAAVGALTLASALAARRMLPRIPYLLIGMIAGSVFAYARRAPALRRSRLSARCRRCCRSRHFPTFPATPGACSRRSRSR